MDGMDAWVRSEVKRTRPAWEHGNSNDERELPWAAEPPKSQCWASEAPEGEARKGGAAGSRGHQKQAQQAAVGGGLPALGASARGAAWLQQAQQADGGQQVDKRQEPRQPAAGGAVTATAAVATATALPAAVATVAAAGPATSARPIITATAARRGSCWGAAASPSERRRQLGRQLGPPQACSAGAAGARADARWLGWQRVCRLLRRPQTAAQPTSPELSHPRGKGGAPSACTSMMTRWRGAAACDRLLPAQACCAVRPCAAGMQGGAPLCGRLYAYHSSPSCAARGFHPHA